MSLEWFDRVCEELQEHLESICEDYDESGHMTIDRSAKHPRIEFFVEVDDGERDYFCTLFFDPYNEEFYLESFDVDLEQPSRAILIDIEDIIDIVHESFHGFINGEDEEEVVEDELESGEYYIGESLSEESDLIEEVDVDWLTPEVTAFSHKDEVEVTYQFGKIEETGDGVLRRINRIWTVDDELIKDETNFIFSKEEANTIIAMIASHVDSLSEFK